MQFLERNGIVHSFNRGRAFFRRNLGELGQFPPGPLIAAREIMGGVELPTSQDQVLMLFPNEQLKQPPP